MLFQSLFVSSIKHRENFGIVAGVLVLFSLLTPYIDDSRTGTDVSWIDPRGGGRAVSWFIFQLAAGGLAIWAGKKLFGRARAATWLGIPVGLCLGFELLFGSERALFMSMPPTGLLLRTIFVLPLAFVTTLVGWSLMRADDGKRNRGRLLTGLGGAVGILLFIIPSIPSNSGERALISQVFKGKSWDEAPFFALTALCLFIYFLYVGIRSLTRHHRHSMIGEVSASAILLLFPLAAIVQAASTSSFIPAFVGAAKWVGWIYGVFGIVWIGLVDAAIVGLATLVGAVSSSMSDVVRGEKYDTVSSLKERLQKLDDLLEEGVLEADEYAAKRKQIIEQAAL